MSEFEPSPATTASPPFAEAIEAIRPDLHRYCTRMTGSVFDGEDVVQDTLLTAQRELPKMSEPPPLRPWLFRIAHNRAIDHLRRSQRHPRDLGDETETMPAERSAEPDRVAIRHDQVASAFRRLLAIPPVQRSCVILKEVFDYPMEEIAAMLDLTVPAVKSALLRGRGKLAELGPVGAGHANPIAAAMSPVVLRYADLFNRRDWDGLRALLVDDVHLDLVSRWQRRGRHDVGSYFGNYASLPSWRLEPGWLEGQQVLGFYRSASAACPAYVVTLAINGTRVACIRDYRYVPYLLQEVLSGTFAPALPARNEPGGSNHKYSA